MTVRLFLFSVDLLILVGCRTPDELQCLYIAEGGVPLSPSPIIRDIRLAIVAPEGDVESAQIDGMRLGIPPHAGLLFQRKKEKYKIPVSWTLFNGNTYAREITVEPGSTCDQEAYPPKNYNIVIQGERLTSSGQPRARKFGFDSLLLPQTVPHLSNVIQISTGENLACALLSDQTIQCWNTSSSDSDYVRNLIKNETSPHLVYTVQSITHATQIAVASLHACALLEDQTVQCWGGGLLGNGTRDSSSTPVSVRNVDSAIQITARYGHSCALLSDRSIQCWGVNPDGQLGNGTTENAYVPVEVQNITNALQVSAGFSHTCALLEDQTVQCWGEGQNGQLGNGLQESSAIPVEVSGLTKVVQVSAGYEATFALLADGTVWTWGRNFTVPARYSPSFPYFLSLPFLVEEAVAVTQVDADGSACLLLEDKTVQCLGAPHFLGGLTEVVQVTSTCALLSDGTVKCSGLW